MSTVHHAGGLQRLVVCLTLLFLLPGAALTVSAQVAEYHDFDELTGALRELAGAHPELARLSSIGTTLEGREIWLLELGAEGDAPTAERPALLVGANIEGDQVVGSELTLLIARQLLDRYATDEDVRERLDNTTIYLLPRINPDAAERMFMTLQTGQSTNAHPFDDDNDGRVDEDGPEDLDGNGLITVMRAADPSGAFMLDPDDERAMKRASAEDGETGAFKLYWEGLDSDGDGFYNEDAPGGVNVDRNFQHNYPYYERGAGPHMVSERESRAVMDIVVAHRNIALIYVFSAHDNLVNAPNNRGELADAKSVEMGLFADESLDEALDAGRFSTIGGGFGRFRQGGGGDQSGGGQSGGRRPATTVNSSDLDYFTDVSEQYGELTGIETLPGVIAPEGALFEYGYYQFGVPSFTSPGWGIPSAKPDSSETDEARPDGGARGGRDSGSSASMDVKVLEWMDHEGIDGFVPWTSYEHPTLGSVEIGGFKPYAASNPPYALLEELAPKQADFVAYLSSLFADVRIADTEVVDHGGGVFRIKADVENAGFLPTSSAHGVVSRSVKPTMVQLGIDPDALLSGDAKTSFFQAMDGSGRRQSFEWLVNGRRGDTIELKVVSQKGGSDTVNLRLE